MALSDADVKRLNQQLAADPQWAALVQAASAEGKQAAAGSIPYGDYLAGKTPAQQAILQYYQSHGIPLGPNSGNNAVVQPDGTIKLNHPYKQFAKEAAISAGVMGGGALALNAAAGAGAAGGAAGGGGSAAGGAAAGGGSAAGGAAAGGGFAAGLKSALPYIIPGAAAVAGSAITAHGNTKAAEIQAKSDAEALAQAKAIYEQQRKDQGPFRQTGYGSLNALNFGLGLPNVDIPQDTPLPSTIVAPGAKDAKGNPMPGAGQNQIVPPSPTMAQQMPGTGGTVPMRNPQTGLVHLIPANQVSAAQQAGGVRV